MTPYRKNKATGNRKCWGSEQVIEMSTRSGKLSSTDEMLNW